MGAPDKRQFETIGINLRKFAEVVAVNFDTVCKKVALDIYTEIKKRTPVDTGRARAGWQITINEPGVYKPPLPVAGAAAKDGPNDLARFKSGDVIYIVNNVDYIVYLEDGTSKQAPSGMVRISIAKIKTELEEIIRLNS